MHFTYAYTVNKIKNSLYLKAYFICCISQTLAKLLDKLLEIQKTNTFSKQKLLVPRKLQLQ